MDSLKGYTKKEIIANTMALSLHKSIMGIAQLDALEKASNVKLYGDFRTAKAILTYYSVYHVFVASILLSERLLQDKDVNKLFKTISKDEYIGLVSEKQLNSTSEHPNQWENQRGYESDLATQITHSQIKKYCKQLREEKAANKALQPYEEILYNAFIGDEPKENEKCIAGLYEKICYIRDRTIYRPSFVVDDKGKIWQTSKDIRIEIDSLPTSDMIYSHVADFIYCLINTVTESNPSARNLLYCFLTDLCECDIDELLNMGHSKEDIERLSQEFRFELDQKDKTICVTAHISQLLELENIDIIVKWHNKFWNPLFVATKQALFKRGE